MTKRSRHILYTSSNKWDGTPKMLHNIPMGKRKECPVCEEMTMFEIEDAAFGCCAACYAKMRREGEV